MERKDREFLRKWAQAGATLDGALFPDRYGLVGNERFTPRARRLALTLWHFGAPRFVSERQERFYLKVGPGACDRRIAKCDRIIRALAGGTTPDRSEVLKKGEGS